MLKLEVNKDVLYCVLKGRMVMKVKVANEELDILYQVNERFGFEEFFMQQPVTYTARADCFTRLSKLSRDNFISCLKLFPILYNDYIKEIELMLFSNDRSILGQKCWFCKETHTSFQCPTKADWREHVIRP